jgi:hypothetical protein
MFIMALTSGMPQRFSLSESVQINNYHQYTLQYLRVTLPHFVLLLIWDT